MKTLREERIEKNKQGIEWLESKFEFLNDDSIYYKVPGIQYLETPKFVILFTSKGGSTIVNNLCKENDLATSVYNGLEFGTIRPSKKDVTEDLWDIIQGKSKKDLIIITRNPIYKWLSGILQELFIDVNQTKLGASYLLEEFKNMNIGDFAMEKHESSVIKKEIMNQENVSKLMYRFLKGSFIQMNTLTFGHSELYNSIFYRFLKENTNIDLTKLKIFDIDLIENDMSKLFATYYPDIKETSNSKGFWTHREKWELFFKDTLQEIIENDDKLWAIIENGIKNDFYYYKLLKSEYAEQNIILK